MVATSVESFTSFSGFLGIFFSFLAYMFVTVEVYIYKLYP